MYVHVKALQLFLSMKNQFQTKETQLTASKTLLVHLMCINMVERYIL